MKMYLYNPETFDPLVILPKSLHRFADDARYFVHKLYVGRIFNKRHKDTFIPLKTSYLRKVMSERKCAVIKQLLIDRGIVVTDGYWIQGKKSTGYMLGSQFKKVKHKRVEITNKRLIKKISSLEGDGIKGNRLDVHLHLHTYLQQIEMDYDSAIKSIEEDFNLQELSIAMLRDRQLFFIADKYGRVHTNLSNLKSTLRPYLRWNNQSLVNIDICNSQPLFFVIVLINYYYKYSLPSLPLLPLRCDILPEDASRFVDLVTQGSIYKYLFEHLEGSPQAAGFKHKLFAEVFFCRNSSWETPCSNLFKKLFPSVDAIIRELKQKDYTFLAKLLQGVESEFIINRVVRRCMDEYPQMPVFTIHDSIMTIESWMETLRAIMLEEFNRIGIMSRMRIERY
jgi:hypothetical protein